MPVREMIDILNPRWASVVLTAVGFFLCSRGTVGNFVTKAPTHPITILGCVLGVVALLAGVVQLFQLRVPILSNPWRALTTIAVIILIKLIVGRLGFTLE